MTTKSDCTVPHTVPHYPCTITPTHLHCHPTLFPSPCTIPPTLLIHHLSTTPSLSQNSFIVSVSLPLPHTPSLTTSHYLPRLPFSTFPITFNRREYGFEPLSLPLCHLSHFSLSSSFTLPSSITFCVPLPLPFLRIIFSSFLLLHFTPSFFPSFGSLHAVPPS